MRAEAAAVINDAASLCTVSRSTVTTDAAGHKVTTWSAVATNEKIWIQPITGREQIQVEGVVSETTHMGYQSYSGYVLSNADRVRPTGDVYDYDVVAVQIHESHRQVQLKRVQRV